MKITLYSTDCPRCKVLEKKLEQKKVDYEVNKNLDDIMKLSEEYGVTSAPILQVGDAVLEFGPANQFINNLVG